MPVDGYRLVYERKVNFDLRLIDPEVPERVLVDVNRTEEMVVKVLVRVSLTPNANADSILGRRR